MRDLRCTLWALLLIPLMVACDDGEDAAEDSGPSIDGAVPAGDAEPCLATAERCDGADNDCDGAIDEEFAALGDPCTEGDGACAAEGTVVCASDGEGVACDAPAGEPSAEVCDGIDNDCNGGVDDGLADGDECDSGQAGPCAAGVQRCVDGQVSCAPRTAATDEICDGLDNDCDAQTDEGPDGQPLTEACYAGPEGTEGVGACVAGTRTCTDGMPGLCRGLLTPIDETCDGVDSDCDGEVDEGLGLGDACAVGIGACVAEGTQVCDPASRGVMCDVSPGAPADEVCNGIDDDCDGASDEVAGAGEPCEAGIGACLAVGVLACGDGELLCGAVENAPAEELCNGIDDDCNGDIDDVAGVGEACAVGEGRCRVEGVGRCDADAGAVVCDAVPGDPAPVELCGDGADDDCDGQTDEADCSMPCGDDAPCAGGQACIEGLCGQPEICDDEIDNDSDGTLDCLDPDCREFADCGPCGNRLLDPDEDCDDGNRAAGDGCSPDCRVEEGFLCAPPGLAACAEGQPAERLSLGVAALTERVGGEGGTGYDDACPEGELIVGFDYHIGNEWRFSNGAVHLQRVRAQCARLDFVDGGVVLTPTGPTPDRGGVPDSGVPAGFTDTQRCPEGQVVRGFTLYGDAQYPAGMGISCGTLSFGGGVLLGEPVALPGAGPAEAVFGAADCPADAVATAHVGRSGHVLDQVALRCAPVLEACGNPSTCAVDRACRYDFAGPDFDPSFAIGGEQPWSIDAEGVATSGPVTHDQQSDLSMAVTMPAGGTVSFRRRVSSEGCCDRLSFSIDGEVVEEWRGEVDWAEVAYDVQPGEHVLRWAYIKDISVDAGEDRGQIDDVAISGAAALCDVP